MYRKTEIPVSKLEPVADYLHGNGVEHWGHKIRRYTLFYRSGRVECEGFTETKAAITANGDTLLFICHYESRTGRYLKIDTTDPTRTIVEADNGDYPTPRLVTKVEQVLGLHDLPERVFISHGTSPGWLEVQRFIEKECQLDTLELAQEIDKGRTIAAKLDQESRHCSYAVIVMTGDDRFEDEVRARQNVMHEIGFFQGRYGLDRVCILHEDGVSVPTNIQGVVYKPFPKGQAKNTFIDLMRELRAAFPK